MSSDPPEDIEAEVRSSRGPGTYLVRLVNGYGPATWECECAGFRYSSRADGLCRHIDEVQATVARVRSLAYLLT